MSCEIAVLYRNSAMSSSTVLIKSVAPAFLGLIVEVIDRRALRCPPHTVEESRHPGNPLLAEVSAERVWAEVHHEKAQRVSAPYVSMYSSGLRTLPLLFDILAPSR